jgi:carboxymethylenebutenolidase
VKREEPMCDELTEKDNDEYLRKNKLTRRKFGQHGVAAAVAMMLPPVANAVDVVEQDVTVDTPDGEADCWHSTGVSGYGQTACAVWVLRPGR